MNESLAYIADGKKVTYGGLIALADKIAGNADPRSIVFFIATNTEEALAAYVGFLRRKVIPVMISPTITSDGFAGLLEAYQPEFIWQPKETSLGAIIKPDMKPAFEYGGYTLYATGYEHIDAPHPDLALMLPTSGSTGSSKYVRLTYRNIEANAQSIRSYLSIKPSDRAITTLPFSYSYGISIVNSHLLAGASLILTEKSFFDKEFWNLLRDEGATSFGGVPYTYAMLKKLRFRNMDLPSLRYLTQAGGRLGEELHGEFASICEEKGIEFFVMYGQTEATARMSYLPADRTSEKIGSIGIAIPGGEFSLEGNDGSVITASDTPGELVYRGENVSMGYAEGRDDLSLGDQHEGILHTGDVACVDKDGYYRIVGRLARFLKIFGNRVNLDEVEALLQKNGFSAACVGTDDAMRIYLEKGDSKEAQRLIAESTGLFRTAFKVIAIESLPRNDAGKVRYAALEEQC